MITTGNVTVTVTVSVTIPVGCRCNPNAGHLWALMQDTCGPPPAKPYLRIALTPEELKILVKEVPGCFAVVMVRVRVRVSVRVRVRCIVDLL